MRFRHCSNWLQKWNEIQSRIEKRLLKLPGRAVFTAVTRPVIASRSMMTTRWSAYYPEGGTYRIGLPARLDQSLSPVAVSASQPPSRWESTESDSWHGALSCVLERDGSNIGQYLLSLRDASVDAFAGFLDALRFVVPYARDLQATLSDAIERRAYLEMTEEEFKVPGWLLSTGTLRVVALLACLRHPNPPPLLIVEEIENGLDPRTLHLVVEEIRSATTAGTTQVILTTHSPYLLDLLDLSHIVVVEREDGQPVFRRPDIEQLGEWSKTFSPGRLYTMGRLTRND